MTAVKNGQLKMKPKWHYFLKTSLWLIGLTTILLSALYLFSLFLFIAHRTGIWIVPVFGLRGMLIFLISLPWLLILAVLLFIVILEISVRHYSFAYRLPLLYSALGVLLIVVVGGAILAGTPLHDMLSHCPPPGAKTVGGLPGPEPNRRVPCGTGFYRDLGPKRFENIYKGVIEGFDSDNFTITDRHQDKLLIVVTKKTRLPFGQDFSVGDMVVVVGYRNGNQVDAFGISKTQ